MADRITEAVNATPYPKAPSIWIAYPKLDDWKRLFVPVLDPKRAGDIHWLRAKHDFMKSGHEKFVTAQLDAVASKSTGQTLLIQFRASPESVMIFPYVFAPYYVDDEVAASIAVELYAATAKGRLMLPKLDDGSPFCARKFDGTRICRGAGTGSAVDIFFWAADPLGFRGHTYSEEEVLLHELVHALRWCPASNMADRSPEVTAIKRNFSPSSSRICTDPLVLLCHELIGTALCRRIV